MKSITFVTGNKNKADYLAAYLGIKLDHKKIDLDEIQSLDLKEIADHKVKQAYNLIKKPVLVEDVSLEFEAFGRLPGTFIKFYVEEIPFETICRSIDGMTRKATAKSMFGFYDGLKSTFFEGKLEGSIAEHPAGNNGFGWDKIFIPEGYNKTRAELEPKEDKETYRKTKPLKEIKIFIEGYLKKK
jgi:non-canonical purine NTP pyrophosphatase (RdgB/HAM1 family)